MERYQPQHTAFQGQGSYNPPPSFQADLHSNSYRGQQSVRPYNPPDSNAASQPPVNIFTPDFSKQNTPVPSAANILRPESRNNVAGSSIQSASVMAPVSSGAGWNDPPPMQSIISKPKTGTNTVPASIQAPITQPLMHMPGSEVIGHSNVTGSVGLPPPPMNPYGSQGGAMSMHPPTSSDTYGQPPQAATFGGYQQDNQFSQQTQHTMFNPVQQPINVMAPQTQMNVSQPNLMNPNQGDQFKFSPIPNQPQSQERAQPRQKEEPKPKAPIPQEHQILQIVFDGLMTRCLAAAAHPQTKRKIEDVGRKLEILYDKLRENSLTPTTLGSLHQLISYLSEASDYQNAMLFYNSIVSGPSFSEIATFAPTIKILIQQATQLQIRW